MPTLSLKDMWILMRNTFWKGPLVITQVIIHSLIIIPSFTSPVSRTSEMQFILQRLLAFRRRKMRVDATKKFDEEVRSKKIQVRKSMSDFRLPTSDFRLLFPEIKGINTSLLEKGISVVFISIQKNRKNHILELNEKLFRETE